MAKWTPTAMPDFSATVASYKQMGSMFDKVVEGSKDTLGNYQDAKLLAAEENKKSNLAVQQMFTNSATNLDEFKAVQDKFSPAFLAQNSELIDPIAAQKSILAQQGVLRGEYQDQFSEDMNRRFAGATTMDQVAQINKEVGAANQEKSWLDIAALTNTGADSMTTARNLDAQQRSNQRIKESANLDVAGLTAARDAIPEDSLNYDTEYKTYNDQIKALKTKNQDVYTKNANTQLHAASLNGVKSLEQARDKLLKQAESDPNLDVSGVRDYFDERRVFALQKTMDKVKSTAKGRRKDELAGNLSALQLATETVFSKGSKAVVFDDVGNFSFAEGVPDALKTEFAQSAKDAGFIGEGADFVTRNDQFFNADSSSLGEDFGSLSSNELDLANQLRQRTNASGLDLSAKATGDLATSTVDIETQYTRNLKRVEDDYKSQELTYAVDPAALKAAQTAKGDAFAHMVSMGFDDNQEWLYELFGDKDAAQDNLRKLINGAKTAGYTDADIIVAIDASTVAAGFLEDKQVNINNFNDFLASTVDLKKKGKDLDKLLAARDIRDAAQLKFDQVRRSDLTAARSGAMTASGVRNSARNAAILDRALGVQ